MYDATGVIGLKYNNSTYLFEKNLQGDIIGIVDSLGERIVTYEYDSWGKVLSIKDKDGNEISNQSHIGIINPFRYRGYYYDSETGLYYLNSRYYNPEWCRFINADGIIGANDDILSFNLYLYVSNNPINLVDKNGYFAGAGVVFGAAVADEVIAGAFGIAAYVIVTAGPALVDTILQIGQSAVETVTDVIQNVIPKRENKKDTNDENGHNVYVLRDRVTKEAEYVGRTKDRKKTEIRHQNNPFRADLKIDFVAKNVSRMTARGLEEALIRQCQTLDPDKFYPRHNQIHGVSERNKNFRIYWDKAQTWLSENEVSCN